MKKRVFPGSPAVRTQYSNCQEPSLIHSIHSQGTKSLQAAAWPKKKKTNKKWKQDRQYSAIMNNFINILNNVDQIDKFIEKHNLQLKKGLNSYVTMKQNWILNLRPLHKETP